MVKLIISVCILFAANFSTAKETLFDLPEIEENIEEKVDELFKQGNYKESFEIHLSLAKLGYKYSQYMVSLQYFYGLGVEKNSLQAYGWANLARRSKSKEVNDFYNMVKSSISEQDLLLSENIKAELSKKYSELVIAKRLQRMIKNTIPKCTGSRLRGACSGFIQHMCIDNGSQESYNKCLREVNLRDPKVIRGLKEALAKTNQYIEFKLQTEGSVIIKESAEQDRTENQHKTENQQ